MFNKKIDGSNVVGAHACRHEHEQQQLGQMPVPMVVHGQGLVERRRELLQSWHQQRCCDDTADEERGATSPLIDVVVRLLPPVDDMSMENAEERFSHTAGCVNPPSHRMRLVVGTTCSLACSSTCDRGVLLAPSLSDSLAHPQADGHPRSFVCWSTRCLSRQRAILCAQVQLR